MGALRQPKLGEPKKPPAAETRKLDQYGRDPESACEKLRARSDIEAQTGFSPFYDSVLADLPRLSSGHVCDMFILFVNMLSYGRFRNANQKSRFTETLPVSAGELAEFCRCKIRDIQRQLKDLAERGMISVKTTKDKHDSAVKYSISLLYADWRSLENYEVWKSRQLAAMPQAEEESEDEEAVPVSTDAVRITKGSETVKPGRATRAKKISVGVNKFKFQNRSDQVDLTHEVVIQSGCVVVSVDARIGEAKAKTQENSSVIHDGVAKSHITEPKEDTSKKRTKGEDIRHPLADSVIAVFDPALTQWNQRLISCDDQALWSACAEVGEMPIEFLADFVNNPRKGRALREIGGPRAVIAIIREARRNWEKRRQEIAKARPAVRCKCGGEIMDVQSQLCARCLDAHTT